MYAILRTKKLKNRSKITSANRHNLRLRWQRNIDPDRTHLNQILYNPMGIDEKDASSFQKKLTEHYSNLGVKEKQNNTLAFEYLATASPEFFENKSPEVIGKWASDQVKFMKNEFGDRLKLAILHLDEKSPHIHFFVSTELKSIKKYRNQKGEFHKETWSLNSEKINPEYLADLQTRFAANNKQWGLIRGVKGSLQKNVPLKVFYKVLDRIMATGYKKKIDQMIDKIELSLGERLNIETIRNKIRDHIAPYINGVMKERQLYKEFTKLDFHKLQTELIEERKKLKLGLDEVDARREVYAEVINKDFHKKSTTEDVIAENLRLQNELQEMKNKYVPDIHPVAEKSVKDKIQFPTPKPQNV
jgi:hypothetical protein